MKSAESGSPAGPAAEKHRRGGQGDALLRTRAGRSVPRKNQEGEVVKSAYGKNLRHPFSGTALAVNNGVPYEIAHIIANHSKEGDGTLRSPEAVAVNKIDMLNYEGLKAHPGIS